MYPSIQQGASGVLQVPAPGNRANSYYPTVGASSDTPFHGQPPGSAFSNGPSTSSGSPTSQIFPLLRVHVADQYRVLPPVMVNPGLEDIKGASFSFDFSYERKVDKEAAAAEAKGDARSSSGSTAGSLQVEDPWTQEILKYTEMGFSREEACMALAALGSTADKDNQFMDFCKHYRELRSMGFPGAVVTGALIQHKNDLSAATEACLAVQ